ncbi:MAG: hypothetical protein KGH60_02925 [Candidatus Micrarchaeota archaeon]|nr:hypothetical protein [Candidatus Micrarchaeota archaeon]
MIEQLKPFYSELKIQDAAIASLLIGFSLFVCAYAASTLLGSSIMAKLTQGLVPHAMLVASIAIGALISARQRPRLDRKGSAMAIAAAFILLCIFSVIM